MTTGLATVKGFYVNRHVRAVERRLGPDGVRELASRVGRPLPVNNSDAVDVAFERQLISHCLDLLAGRPIPPESRDVEAGRLHFRNFVQTPYARIIFTVFRNNPRLMLLHGHRIAEHIGRGMKFSAVDNGDHFLLEVTHAGYPLDHVRGLLHEWSTYCGCRVIIQASELRPGCYEFRVSSPTPL